MKTRGEQLNIQASQLFRKVELTDTMIKRAERACRRHSINLANATREAEQCTEISHKGILKYAVQCLERKRKLSREMVFSARISVERDFKGLNTLLGRIHTEDMIQEALPLILELQAKGYLPTHNEVIRLRE